MRTREICLARQQALTCANTFQRMEHCIAMIFQQIGQTFGVEVKAVEASGEPEAAGEPVSEDADGGRLKTAGNRSETGLSLMEDSVLSLEKELDSVKAVRGSTRTT